MMFVASEPSLIESPSSQYLEVLERVFHQSEHNESIASGPFILKGAQISNSIKTKDRLKIWKILKQNCSSVTYVGYSYCHTPDDAHKINEEEIESLEYMTSPEKTPCLRVLALDFTEGGNCQKYEQSDSIGHILYRLIDNLKNHKGLKKFYSSFARISDLAATVLAEILKDNASITTVGLQPNVMTIIGVKNLFRGLMGNTTLEILDIANGDYEEKDVLEELKWFLIKNKTIHTLQFGYFEARSMVSGLIKTTKDESLKKRLKGMMIEDATL